MVLLVADRGEKYLLASSLSWRSLQTGRRSPSYLSLAIRMVALLYEMRTFRAANSKDSPKDPSFRAYLVESKKWLP